tara:strand:- start:702 stop:812 length:111 start_codon:yes stop_codon:yes gene_type:complete
MMLGLKIKLKKKIMIKNIPIFLLRPAKILLRHILRS